MAIEIGLLLLRLVVWFGIPIFLIILLIGPRRVADFWGWVFSGRQDPTVVLNRVVHGLQQTIESLRGVLQQAEATQAEIQHNRKRSQESLVTLEKEARTLVASGDDLGARAALSKFNVERLALKAFEDQLQQQQARSTETRRRLHLLELQLRQYEVGRSILLTQLAEARTVEQQYALANQFDPFSAVADWHRAQGKVQEKAETARAVEQVYQDTADLPLNHQPVRVDPEAIDDQLTRLKEQMRKANNGLAPR
jgi:phage shock protein A